MPSAPLRVLIVAENASTRFGGEAALSFHYFRCLRARKVEAWMIVHERTREELLAMFPREASRISFVKDTLAHRSLWNMTKMIPVRRRGFSLGSLMRFLSQAMARRLAEELVTRHSINVIHVPSPVSPREPLLPFDMGPAVVIGPMNGGMRYPPGFEHMQPRLSRHLLELERTIAPFANILVPGKRRADILLAANERTRAALPAGTGGRVEMLVENGVDLELWKSTEKRIHPDGVVRFVFVGRLVELKGVHLLLRAFARLPHDCRSRLEIIGDGPQRERLVRLGRDLGVEDRVRFHGWLPQRECAGSLQGSDVFVFPSLRDCGGAAVLEAMASGLPVIAACWGGPEDYVDPSCGILVPPITEEQFTRDLARSMTRLARDPDLRRTMGERGRMRVVREFDWDRKTERILEIYRQAIGWPREEADGFVPVHRESERREEVGRDVDALADA